MNCTLTQQPRVTGKSLKNGANRECRERTQRWYLKVRRHRDAPSHRKIHSWSKPETLMVGCQQRDTTTYGPLVSKEVHRLKNL